MTSPSVDTTCELTVAGPLAHSFVQAVRARFTVDCRRSAEATVLTVGSADQAAVRAVMTMLWDSGHVVLAMATRSGGVDRPEP